MCVCYYVTMSWFFVCRDANEALFLDHAQQTFRFVHGTRSIIVLAANLVGGGKSADEQRIAEFIGRADAWNVCARMVLQAYHGSSPGYVARAGAPPYITDIPTNYMDAANFATQPRTCAPPYVGYLRGGPAGDWPMPPVSISPAIPVDRDGIRVAPFDNILPPSVDDIILDMVLYAAWGSAHINRFYREPLCDFDEIIALGTALVRLGLVSKKFLRVISPVVEVLKNRVTSYKSTRAFMFFPLHRPPLIIMRGLKLYRMSYFAQRFNNDINIKKVGRLTTCDSVDLNLRAVRGLCTAQTKNSTIVYSKESGLYDEWHRGVVRVSITNVNQSDFAIKYYSRSGRLIARSSNQQFCWYGTNVRLMYDMVRQELSVQVGVHKSTFAAGLRYARGLSRIVPSDDFYLWPHLPPQMKRK